MPKKRISYPLPSWSATGTDGSGTSCPEVRRARDAFRIASTETPTSANTASHMLAMPKAPKANKQQLNAQRKYDVLPHNAQRFVGKSGPPPPIWTACRPSVRYPQPRSPHRNRVPPMAMPISARESTGASLMPSPTKASFPLPLVFLQRGVST